MKKILLSLVVAATALFATSCANELEEGIQGNGNGVTFEISTPELASRAFGDGESVAKLMYAVYEVGQNGYTKVDGVSCTDGVTFNGSKTTVAIELLDGYTYDILFWAAGANYTDAYTINWANKTVTMDGTIPSNNDAFDGFYKHITVTVNGAVTESVTLERPFAQLNIGTSDFEQAQAAGFVKSGFTSSVVVKGMPNVLNCATGNVSGTADIEYTAATIDANEAFGVGGYEYVAMNYVLVGADKQLANIELTVEGGKKITNIYNNVPFQRNYKTNVYGALLTNGSQFTVDIDKNWATETLPNEEGDKLVLAGQMGGEYTLTENAVLPSTLEVTTDMVINLDGKTLDGDINVANGVNLEVNNGTITNDDKSVSGITSNGNLTLNDVEITSARHAVRVESGKVVINGGLYTVNPAPNSSMTIHALNVGDNGTVAEVIIKGGTFIGPKGTSADSGSAVNVRAGSKVTIEGGDFSGGKTKTLANGGTLIVKGGSFDQNPAAFIADGYKAVESNGKWVVVAEEVDAVVSTQEALNNTTINDNDTVVLTAGAYVIPAEASGKTLTIQGTGNPEDVTVTAQNAGAAEGNCDYSLRGSTATFNDVTITTTGTYFPGYAGLKGTFNNCIINGVYSVYDNSTFNNCTFNIEGDLYNLWTWGGAEVVLNNCTFNCDGKAVLLYGMVNTKLTVNNCTFNDNGGLADLKAAIEIGNDYGKSYELIVNNTTVNGFEINDKGYVTGTTLWANKNSMPADKLKVTVDGKNAYTIVAADAAGLNSAIAVGATNVILEAGNYTMPEPDLRGKSLTIVGTKDVVIDATAVDARDQFVTGATLVFDGVTVNFGTTNYMGFANAASLTYKNCDINGLQFLFNPTSFENCKFNSTGEHCVWTYGSKQVSFTNCEFTYADRCVNVYVDNGTEDVAVDFTNCKFNTANAASAGAVEINASAFPQGANVDFDGCTAPANGHMVFISKWDPTVGATANVTVDGVAYTTPVQQ